MRLRRREGLTLLELMLVIAILGILAALAIPAFSSYRYRSKSSEATEQLKSVFNHASSYYHRETAERGMNGSQRVNCSVGSTDNAVTPDDQKQLGDYSSNEWKAVGYTLGYGYYRYEIVNPAGGACSLPPSNSALYTLRAVGDLDADGDTSLFELAVGTNGDNEVYHALGFYISSGTE